VSRGYASNLLQCVHQLSDAVRVARELLQRGTQQDTNRQIEESRQQRADTRQQTIDNRQQATDLQRGAQSR
jgi:hypothetical protein